MPLVKVLLSLFDLCSTTHGISDHDFLTTLFIILSDTPYWLKWQIGHTTVYPAHFLGQAKNVSRLSIANAPLQTVHFFALSAIVLSGSEHTVHFAFWTSQVWGDSA